jgi:Xaa-Pro aminopeptidase
VLTNRVRLDRYMDKAGIAAVISWTPHNVRYLTGYWCWLAPLFRECMVVPGGSGDLVQRNVALVPREGEPCLVLEPYWAVNAFESWVRDVRVAGSASFMPGRPMPDDLPALQGAALLISAGQWASDRLEVLRDALRERGLVDARLGVDFDDTSPAERAALAAALPEAQLEDCSNLLRLVRAQKTAGEIAALERAAGIAEQAAMESMAEVKPGMTLDEVSLEFRRRIGARGAEFDHFAAGARGLGFVAAGRYPFPGDEAFYLDYGCVCDGFFSDAGVTMCLGELDEASALQYDAVRSAVATAASLLRPGVRGSVVQAAMVETLAERGITRSFPHGHGLGLEIRDYPLLMPANGKMIADDCIEESADLVLEEGMVLNLEAPVLTPGVRSVHCEETFVVTSDGCRHLVAQDRRRPVQGATRGAT